MTQDACPRCGGSGYRSAAADAGMQDLPVMLQPIGVYPCSSCNGTGKMFGFTEQDWLEISRDMMNR